VKRGTGRAQTRDVDVVQLVAFHVGAGTYAIDIMRIKEIVNPVKVTPVPKAPPFVEGVIELRGAIQPLIDLRKRFDLPPTPITRSTKYMIVTLQVGDRRYVVALVTDGVAEPLRVAREQIRPAPALTRTAAYFSGAVRRDLTGGDSTIVMIVDVDSLLSGDEKTSLVGIGGGAA
jgi:purine-binding chemotaxis protein CheW